jgi:hypothetical protein
MAVPNDVLNAKQSYADHLRRARAEGPAGAFRTLSVEEAVRSAKSNVHAIGVGRKIVSGKVSEDSCVRFYVVQKLAPSLLSPEDKLPSDIEGIATDVIESPQAFILNGTCTDDVRKKQRPIMGGISASHHLVTDGTIACMCRSVAPGDDASRVYALSNNHVFANLNRANAGDELYQPSPADGGTANELFARVHRFVPISLGELSRNRVDAAIGEVVPGIETDFGICSIGNIAGTGEPQEEMAVCKHGRSTGYTEGFVFDESLDATVRMDHNDPFVIASFQNQFRIDAPLDAIFAKNGDSGSLVLNKLTKTAVGLVSAGAGGYALANRIQDVMNELQIVLL